MWATEFTTVFTTERQQQVLETALETLEDAHSEQEADTHHTQDVKKRGRHGNKTNGAYHYLLGNLYYRTGHLKEAAKYYEEACLRSPEEPSYFNSLGGTYYGCQEFSKARENYKKARSLNNNSAVYDSNLALALAGLMEWDKSIAACRKAMAKEPRNVYYTQLLATIYNSEGNEHYEKEEYGEAKAAYEKAIAADSDTLIYRSNLAVALRELKEWDRAIIEAKEARNLEPKTEPKGLAPEISYQTKILAMIYSARGNDHFEKSEFAEAIADYDEAIATDKGTAMYHSNLAVALRELGRWDQAIASCQKSIELDPQNHYFVQVLGATYNIQGNYELSQQDYAAARVSYEKAIKCDGEVAVYHVNLGLALIGLKDWEGAFDQCEKVKKLDPNGPLHDQILANVNNGMGNDYFSKGQNTLAVAAYEKAIELNEELAVYHANLGLAFQQLSDWPRAEAQVRRAIELEPENQGYRSLLKSVLDAEGDSRKRSQEIRY